MEIITIEDLPDSIRNLIEAEMLQMMVDGLNSRAVRVAPCLGEDPDPGLLAEAKLILIGVIKRWAEAGSGAFTQQTAGSFSVSMDTRQRTGWNLRPSEIGDLQDLCKQTTGNEGKAWSVAVGPVGVDAHLPWCDLAFGGPRCSCGASLTAGEYPLYELG